jgi:hypothetical protein
MTTIPQTQTQTTAQFDSALRALAIRATERYPGEQARIERGLLLALDGHVTLHEDGTAMVGSASDSEVWYWIERGTCDCPDFSRAPDGRCKHRYAVALVRKAQTQMAAPTYTRVAYHATYAGAPGMAIRDEQGAVWFVGETEVMIRLRDADIPHLHLNGRVDLAADQRRLDLLARTDLSQLDSRRMADL